MSLTGSFQHRIRYSFAKPLNIYFSSVRTMPNRKGNKGKSSLRGEIKRLEHRIQGVKISASPDPPSVTTVPWYNLTVSFNIALTSTAIVHTVSTIRTQLSTQLGLASGTGFTLRIREVRTWGPLGGDIKCEFFDYDTGSLLQETTDVGSLTTRPHCGYVWPSGLSTRSLAASSENVLQVSTNITTPIAGTTSSAIHYLVQFKLSGVTPT
jgi:hypothetical protein